MRNQAKRHLPKKSAAIAVVDTKKSGDLQAEEKWNIIDHILRHILRDVDETRWWY